ncbi:MAG: ROK family protein [Gemmataceae bacterium]
MFLAVEIGGSKLQLGLGPRAGELHNQWRGTIDPKAGASGILQQLQQAIPPFLQNAAGADLRGIGVGFGGPTDDTTQSTIKSHQVEGWENFPLAQWFHDQFKVPTVVMNDADTAGLAEAMAGAGANKRHVFYITAGSGVGGGFIINQTVYRGNGRGAAEIGHLKLIVGTSRGTLEEFASGWGIEKEYQKRTGSKDRVPLPEIAKRNAAGDAEASSAIGRAVVAMAQGISTMTTLLCPDVVVIGGGVSLLGETYFDALRSEVASRTFEPFAGQTEILPAVFGEDVVLHGALALAAGRLA